MKTTFPGKWALAAIGAAITGVAVGAGGVELARQYFVQGPSASQIIVLPGGNADNDGDIALLNTMTGAVYRFRGDIDNSSVRNTWELRVAPVKEETSGLLEIQTVDLAGPQGRPLGDAGPDATFLVDIVTGRTWILRQRASTNASWDPVEFFQHSNWGAN